eukprot:CAMPEP_0177665636 /NCGR_PEP_ID=MMETSP0447-20121125/21161_1 /TAXON_ID=0 /ORGANISM="Stygamoeba regulata, Strain BSH-02190019" /LENGTH=49 /DNA_ID=CAMNT_0019171745 /DNA_START=60 /DNA_END=209 /DNA_ORIENTATION=+
MPKIFTNFMLALDATATPGNSVLLLQPPLHKCGNEDENDEWLHSAKCET